jgi:hypothetical protein
MKTEYILGGAALAGIAWYFYSQSQKSAAAAQANKTASVSASLPIPSLPMTGPNGTAINFPASAGGGVPTPIPVFTVPTPQGNVQVTPVDSIPTSLGAILNAIPAQSVAAVTSPMTLGEVQHALNVLGANPQLSEDGINGPMTKSAVMGFQNQHGLVADGIAGPKTQAAIQMALAAQQGMQQQQAQNTGLILPPGVSIGPDGQLLGL